MSVNNMSKFKNMNLSDERKKVRRRDGNELSLAKKNKLLMDELVFKKELSRINRESFFLD